MSTGCRWPRAVMWPWSTTCPARTVRPKRRWATSSVGVARALVAELGCAVVAMRHPVLDDFAVGFADALYDRVFRHGHTLDRAVAAAVLGPRRPSR